MAGGSIGALRQVVLTRHCRFLANFCAKCEHSADVLPIFGSLADEATPFRFLQTAERFIKETYGISLPVPESKDDVVQQFP